jgi:hypothetical protein
MSQMESPASQTASYYHSMTDAEAAAVSATVAECETDVSNIEQEIDTFLNACKLAATTIPGDSAGVVRVESSRRFHDCSGI